MEGETYAADPGFTLDKKKIRINIVIIMRWGLEYINNFFYFLCI